MKIARNVKELRHEITTWKQEGKRISFVPTMGALHEGHLSLVGIAREKADIAVASVFVNPSQFGPNEDFSRYPRQEEKDAALLGKAGASLLFLPSVPEIYPSGFRTVISVKELTEVLCGKFRPGHFDGVATVVARLLMLTMPDSAIFGEKDFQQLMVIRRMAEDLALPVEIIGAPIIREPDGLALSSRNAYLSAEERRIAPAIYGALTQAAEEIKNGASTESACRKAQEKLLAAGFSKIDYLEARNEADLSPASSPPCRLFAAAWLGKTRLIDNVRIA